MSDFMGLCTPGQAPLHGPQSSCFRQGRGPAALLLQSGTQASSAQSWAGVRLSTSYLDMELALGSAPGIGVPDVLRFYFLRYFKNLFSHRSSPWLIEVTFFFNPHLRACFSIAFLG